MNNISINELTFDEQLNLSTRQSTDTITVSNIKLDKQLYNLSPLYQRGSGVYTLGKKQKLIIACAAGTLLSTLYLHEQPADSNGRAILDVMDGVQRLSTIFEFFDNKFSITLPNFAPKKFFWRDIEKIAASDKGSKFATIYKNILGTKFNVVKYRNCSLQEQSFVFNAVNSCTPLTEPEQCLGFGFQVGIILKYSWNKLANNYFKPYLTLSAVEDHRARCSYALYRVICMGYGGFCNNNKTARVVALQSSVLDNYLSSDVNYMETVAKKQNLEYNLSNIQPIIEQSNAKSILAELDTAAKCIAIIMDEAKFDSNFCKKTYDLTFLCDILIVINDLLRRNIVTPIKINQELKKYANAFIKYDEFFGNKDNRATQQAWQGENKINTRFDQLKKCLADSGIDITENIFQSISNKIKADKKEHIDHTRSYKDPDTGVVLTAKNTVFAHIEPESLGSSGDLIPVTQFTNLSHGIADQTGKYPDEVIMKNI